MSMSKKYTSGHLIDRVSNYIHVICVQQLSHGSPQPEANEDAGRHGFRLVGGIYIYNKICFESFVFNFFQTVLVVLWLTGGVPLSDPW